MRPLRNTCQENPPFISTSSRRQVAWGPKVGLNKAKNRLSKPKNRVNWAKKVSTKQQKLDAPRNHWSRFSSVSKCSGLDCPKKARNEHGHTVQQHFPRTTVGPSQRAVVVDAHKCYTALRERARQILQSTLNTLLQWSNDPVLNCGWRQGGQLIRHALSNPLERRCAT